MKIEVGTRVKVASGDQRFEGFVDKVEWDLDQWIYWIDEQWYCQSEVTAI